jgi:alpha-D-ribose 1-methylphosphonate 5-triphosphate synthase subunit PhnG
MMDAKVKQESSPDPARKEAMRLLAQATLAELKDAWEALADRPEVHPVRGPETGLVMVRGSIGGGGDPFNLGEATVSRATVRLSTGEIGHGQLLGTDKERARFAAIFDALSQRGGDKAGVDALLGRVAERLAQDERRKAEETAATRVDFFTMVRGDD